jgi:deoxyribodipyrimidine photo-lyase
MQPVFETDYQRILQQIESIDPIKYAATRNFLDGDVTYLSPYISRGVISTKQILESLLKRGYQPIEIQPFLRELGWREYFQRVWQALGKEIDKDVKHPQAGVLDSQISANAINAKTGIIAIGDAINNLYATGYMHNHSRLYTASLICNVAKTQWLMPAKWMYYYLLDADWASNALSWQWVAGANSIKKYYANQENINRFCATDQTNTFLDVPYEAFPQLEVPDILSDRADIHLTTTLPPKQPITLNKTLPTLLYNHYNLSPTWRKEESANRVLLLEPSHFKEYPISPKTLDFVLALSKNINNIQVYVGDYNEFVSEHTPAQIIFKSHPFSNHYEGICDEQDWMFTVKGNFPSFSNYWKNCMKEMDTGN